MSLNESIIKIRVELQNKKLKKSGKNKFAGFEYYELADFLPMLNTLMLEEGVNDRFYITADTAYLEIIKGEEKQTYTIPFTAYRTPLNKNGQPSMQDIQYFGALNTYYKRYLYLNAFGITDGEIVDAMDNTHHERMITKDQAEKLVALISKTGSDYQQVMDYYKISDVLQMTEAQYTNAFAMLKAKEKKNGN